MPLSLSVQEQKQTAFTEVMWEAQHQPRHHSDSWANQFEEEEGTPERFCNDRSEVTVPNPHRMGQRDSDIKPDGGDQSSPQDELHQADSDVAVEEDDAACMETDRSNANVSYSSNDKPLGAPSPMHQGSEPVEQDLDSEDPNPPNDSDLDEDMEDKLLGMQDIIVPGGYSDNSVTLRIHLEEDLL